MWIDSHCHLNHPRFEGRDPADIIKSAHEAGIEGMVNISTTITGDFKDVQTTANAHKNIWCTVGTHPHYASDAPEKAISKEKIIEIAQSDPNIIGIGESGLDYYYDNATPEDQEKSFRKHIQACIEADLPIIIHARDADKDIARIMFEEEGAGTNLRGVMHCFSSGRALAEAALDFGFYISFSGIVTFKQAETLREIAKDIPLDRILVETDAPFLAPAPHRGKTNEPAYVQHTGATLAELHKISKEKLASHSKQNFFNLFTKAELA